MTMLELYPLGWTRGAVAGLAAFLASLVECVEALTIVLAVGVTRGWRSAITGATAGLGLLVLLVLVFGPLLRQASFSLGWLQIALGALLLFFGVGWLRKAVLRAAGIIPLHDEARLYREEVRQMKRRGGAKSRWDWIALAASFKAVMVEGTEVVFIVLAIGTTGSLLVPACAGAAAALLLVTLLGIALHKPLTRIPENSLKFGVGVILSAFGIFWIGAGGGLKWPGGDLSIPALIVVILLAALSFVKLMRKSEGANARFY